jgi:AraC-like DNA-binding protein
LRTVEFFIETGLEERKKNNMESLKGAIKKYHLDKQFFLSPTKCGGILLYQIGDLYCGGGYYLKKHKQIVYEITYVYSGKGKFFVNGKGYDVKKGNIIINKPGDMHEGEADAIDPFRFFYLGFLFSESKSEDEELLINIKSVFDNLKNPLTIEKANIQDVFTKAYREFINGDSYSKYLIKNYLLEILITTSRDLSQNNKLSSIGYEINVNLLERIINYIDMNFEKDIKVEDISISLGYSSSYISHLFSKHMGISIKSYYDTKRLEKAVSLLKESNTSISDIAVKLNFKSLYSFSRAVKVKYGAAPSFIRNHRE